MKYPSTLPIPDLETLIAQVGTLADALAEAVDYALHAEAGGQLRADHANDALANLEELEGVIQDARRKIEALP